MPTHGYTTTRRPPSVIDHILAHCFELGLSVWAIVGGAAAIAAGLMQDERTVSLSLDRLPSWLGVLVGGMFLIGGMCIIRGLFDDSDDLRAGWWWERAGLALTGPAWAAYGATVVALSPAAFFAWSFCFTMALVSLLRFVATIVSHRALRAVIDR